MEFPTAQAILDLHSRILQRTGGTRGILNQGGVESAIDRATWGPFWSPPDLALRAAFLLRGICQDHPFADGNKRTAFEATDTLLRLNGTRIVASPDEVLVLMLAVAQGLVGVEGIARWLRAHAKDYRPEEAIE